MALAQAATRDGFDLTRHPLSALGTGGLGWVQITNFVVAGVLVLIGAPGLGGAVSWLLRVYGTGMVAAGLLVPDPADGFPAGTPAGPPSALSWHAAGHLAAGSLAFLALMVACFVLGRRFARAGDRRDAVLSVVAGAALLLGNLWAMSGGRAGTLTLAVGVITAML
ncbi:hypothetical protein GCM10017567_09600 [Amycolatopsis bullii]|uniref:DUF998 domain-containing protein n=1 Tax=Amycolatopsis bullii TaxID=941987 RepID=A0ABQ3JZK6_9PSEU|nr:hypothetical protein GCM10017567_09600 [Amycolatopsis bullii]